VLIAELFREERGGVGAPGDFGRVEQGVDGLAHVGEAGRVGA
jgi:hypothetical protein